MYLTGVSGQLSRHEYVAWVNFILNTHMTKLDDLRSGSAAAQILDLIFPQDKLDLTEINFADLERGEMVSEYDALRNWKVFSQGLARKGIRRTWRYDELANGRQLLDFVQWLKGLYDSSGPITRPAQDSVKRRRVSMFEQFLQKHPMHRTAKASPASKDAKSPFRSPQRSSSSPQRPTSADRRREVHTPPLRPPTPPAHAEVEQTTLDSSARGISPIAMFGMPVHDAAIDNAIYSLQLRRLEAENHRLESELLASRRDVSHLQVRLLEVEEERDALKDKYMRFSAEMDQVFTLLNSTDQPLDRL